MYGKTLNKIWLRQHVMCHKKCCEDAELVLCSSRDGELKYISGHTVLQDGSNETTFDPPSVPLDSMINPIDH